MLAEYADEKDFEFKECIGIRKNSPNSLIGLYSKHKWIPIFLSALDDNSGQEVTKQRRKATELMFH